MFYKTDFRNLEKYEDKINGDDCYFCIGTTKKDTPDNNEYRDLWSDFGEFKKNLVLGTIY